MGIQQLSREEMVEIYDLTFKSTHSPGFKEAEVKDLLTDSSYCFGIDRPIEGWQEKVKDYLNKKGVEIPEHLVKNIVTEY